MIDNLVNIFLKKVLFRFHIWEKKKFEGDPPLLSGITFIVVCVLLNKLNSYFCIALIILKC